MALASARETTERLINKVYLCKHTSEEKEYVIKKMHIFEINKREKDNIENEIKLLSQLKHPNIVLYKESFNENKDYINIVMQYCEGGDLYKKIRNRNGKRFPETTVLKWTAQLVLSLHFLHERKVLHRDLKTQNIFLSEGRLFLGDFGISKTLENTRELANTYIGTPYYMSPELFNYKPYSYKSDIWSLGCVLYEICNLRHTFNAQTINGLAVKILKGNYHPVSAQFSKPLRDFISSLLVVDPKQRPSIRKIVQMPFIKKQIASYLVDLVKGVDLGEDVLDSLKMQVAKIGLDGLIRDISGEDSAVVNTLLAKRDQSFELKELANCRLQKQVQLGKELELKERLEKELKGLIERKKRLKSGKGSLKRKESDFDQISKSGFESDSNFQKSVKDEFDYSMDFYNDEYDDFEFIDDIEEHDELSAEQLDKRIGEFEARRAKNVIVLAEIKAELNKIEDKQQRVGNTHQEKTIDDFDDEEFYNSEVYKEANIEDNKENTDNMQNSLKETNGGGKIKEGFSLVGKLEERVIALEGYFNKKDEECSW